MIAERTKVRFVKDHLPFVASAALIVLAVLRVLAFCRFRLDTSLLVLSVADRIQLLTATLLESIVAFSPLVVVVPSVFSWLFVGAKPGSTKCEKARSWLGIPLAFVTLVIPLTILMGVMVGSVAGFIARRFLNKRGSDRTAKPAKVMKAARLINELIVVWIAFSAVFTLVAPWQAKEVINSDDGSKYIGYVIGEQSGMTLILDEDRSVQWLLTSKIAVRGLCVIKKSVWTGSIADLVATAGERCEQIDGAGRSAPR